MFQIIDELKYIGIGIRIGDFHSYQNISYCAYQYTSNYNISKYITYMMLNKQVHYLYDVEYDVKRCSI